VMGFWKEAGRLPGRCDRAVEAEPDRRDLTL
jgi:hypothetical protein